MFPRDTDSQREMLYNEQVKTNVLLAEIIELLKPKQPQEPKTTAPRPTNTRKPNTRGKAK